MHLILFAAVAWGGVPLTMAEVARHDRPDDCWLVLDGAVYDLTGFIAAHPGGEAILRGCGKDASWFFAHRDGATGHSEAARQMLPAFEVGKLGDTVDVEAPPEVHPHTQRAAGTYAGMLPTTAVTPARSLHLRIRHHMPTRPLDPLRVAMEFGVGVGGWLDLHLGDVTGDGVSGLDAKARLLDQHGDQAAPLSLAVSAGAGMAHSAGAPAFTGELTVDRTFLDRRLTTRLAAVGARSDALPAGQGSTVGTGIEFRPIPVHGVFADVLVPVWPADASAVLAWDAGLRFHTRSHHISVYAASPAPLSTLMRAGPGPEGVSLGFVLERDFQLGN